MANRIAIERCAGGFRLLLLMPVVALGQKLWVMEVMPGSFKTARDAANIAVQMETLHRDQKANAN